MGEQMKCKIIMKLNKLKVSKEQFNKSVDNHLENIDYFYNSLISFIDQQRVNDRQEILRIKNMVNIFQFRGKANHKIMKIE